MLPQATANGTETAENGTEAAENGTTTSTSDAGANESVAPGQQLAGVVGVQGAEIESEIGERSFSTRVSRAESNTSKAAVVATEVNQARDRLASLRERQERLREAYQSGNSPRASTALGWR
ncbi:hypothetical protein ACFQL0_02585 [Haloplanus litoreus]|uniref:hypothetical protein n=1 Tax=Haloplanus litoreus TaxID=767515 RepID=UPI00361C9C6F